MAGLNKPFLLTPAAKDYLWGGNRLNDDFNLNQPVSPFAEAWVCSTHPDGPSYVKEYDCTLSELLEKQPELLGTHAKTLDQGRMPILVKLIDAKKDLSIQVHPDDDYARKHEASLGKTEMWYVLDAKKGSELVHGFKYKVTKDEVKNYCNNGSLLEHLNHVQVKSNDVFFIKAGTVHAIGAGCLIAEVQESSNLTYRVYDYNRLDKYGNKRELHLDKALDVMNLNSTAVNRQPMRVMKYKNGVASELLASCRYFKVERMLLNTEVHRQMFEYRTQENSFHALLCVGGCGSIFGEDLFLNFFKGDCLFVPANSVPLKIHGRAQLLDVSC